jgi:hypothetical protein
MNVLPAAGMTRKERLSLARSFGWTDVHTCRVGCAHLECRRCGAQSTRPPGDATPEHDCPMGRTKPPRRGWKLVPCVGEHSAHVDGCGRCAPRWGWVEIPARFATLEAYRSDGMASRLG